MQKKPNLALPLLLLAGTTLAIGGIVYGLLWKESNRLRHSALASATAQADTVVENIGLTVGEIKTALMQALLEFEGPEFAPQLSAWQAEDTFVDFAFVWRQENPNTVAIFPQGIFAPTGIDSPLRRQNGQWIWQAPPPLNRKAEDERLTVLSDLAVDDADRFSNYAETESVRKSIRSQSQLSTRIAKSSLRERRRWTSDSAEWIHTAYDSQSYWIGFSNWNQGTVVTGAGLNLAQIANLLEKSFPSELVSTIEYMEIRDAEQERVAATGSQPSSFDSAGLVGRKSALVLPIGPDLPGWTLRMQTNVDGSLSRALLSPAGIATACVILALVAAGLWLAYQSRSTQLDAARKVSFVANVSHELKTPLTTIRMFSELMQSGRVSDAERRNSYLTTITKESQRLTRLVNNVLDFSRLDRGHRKIDARLQELRPVLNEYLEIRKPDLRHADMELELDLPSGELDAFFDRDALCQILGNLIDNAVKYARAGKLLRICVHASEQFATIEISDRGAGLPAHLRKKRFRSFERGDDSLTNDTSGFGLGLSISQTLAESMDATLRYRHPRKSNDLPTFLLTLTR